MLSRLKRRCLPFLLAGAILFASVGLSPVWAPVPQPVAGPTDSGEWFPCKDHHCGCLNAEMCRTQCCCHLTWPSAEPVPPKKPCCSHKQSEPERPIAADASPPASGVTLAMQSAGCAGRAPGWVATKVACWLVQHTAVVLRVPLPVERSDTHVVAVRPQASLRPEPPPPRER